LAAATFLEEVSSGGRPPFLPLALATDKPAIVRSVMRLASQEHGQKTPVSGHGSWDPGQQIVTIDAMGCQTAIAGKIQEQSGDYLLALKGNHTKAYTAITQYFHQHIEHNFPWRDVDHFFDAFDITHGRRVRRRVGEPSQCAGTKAASREI